jgi:nicotinamidase-related amidase
MITLPTASTALILIDLQKGIAAYQLAPYSFEAVLAKGKELARRFRVAKAPEYWSELADGLAEASDLKVTKRQWGAFYGTDLDLQLRRRGVTTVVIGGVATNMGVESTARAAHEHGYAVVLAEDAATSLSAEMHAFAFEHVFPHLGRVAKAAEIEL